MKAEMKSTTNIKTEAILRKVRAFFEFPSPMALPVQTVAPIYPPKGIINTTMKKLSAMICAPVASTLIALAIKARISRPPHSKQSMAALGTPIFKNSEMPS